MYIYEINIWFYETPVVYHEFHEVKKEKNGKYYFRRDGNLRDTVVDSRELNRMRTLFPRIGDGDMHNRIYVVADNPKEANEKLSDVIGKYLVNVKHKSIIAVF